MKYFIFKHVEFSGYKDKKGLVYHYTEKSPNWEKVEEGAKVLLYEKETNCIFACATIGRIEKIEKDKQKEFFAFYKNLQRFKVPIELNFKLRKQLRLRDLELPSPGIIPIEKKVFRSLRKLASQYS